MASRLVFTDSSHSYSLDGQRVPGVTSIVNKASSSEGLINWAAKEAAAWAALHVHELDSLGAEVWADTAAGAHRRLRDSRGKRGRQVHHLARQLVWGEPVPAEDPQGLPYPDDVLAMAAQVARFQDAWDAAPVLAESPVFHELHRWAGTLDLVADLSDGARWLIDYKTGDSGPWFTVALQVGAYGNATHVQVGNEDKPMPAVDRYGVLWVREDSWQLIPLHVDEDTYRTFGHMKQAAAWLGQRPRSIMLDPLPEPGAA